jgi:hypothetical protein
MEVESGARKPTLSYIYLDVTFARNDRANVYVLQLSRESAVARRIASP